MLRIPPCRTPIPTLKQSDVLPAHFMQLSALWCKLLIIVHVLSWIPAWYIRRNRCECITLSNAAFASRSTRCPFYFSSVNILYASLTGRAAFMGDDPFVNPLCVGFCILWINGCILSLITASTILLIQAELLFLDSWWHRFCFRRQMLHTFIFCEYFIKWNNGSMRLTLWKQKIGDSLLNTTCACQSDRVCHPLQMNF